MDERKGVPILGTKLVAFGFDPEVIQSKVHGYTCERHHVTGFDLEGRGCWFCQREREQGSAEKAMRSTEPVSSSDAKVLPFRPKGSDRAQ